MLAMAYTGRARIASAGGRADARGKSANHVGAGSAGVDGVLGDSARGVAGIQRARMIAAMVQVAAERGVGQVTVAHVVARSGVSRRTFYELFDDREACFLAAFDEAVARAAVSVVPAFGGAGGWRERVRAALGALLEFLDDEPDLGAFCVVDALGAGPLALARRARVVDVLVDAVDEGRGEAKVGLRPTRLTAEGVVGAVLGVLHARLARGAQPTRQSASPSRGGGGSSRNAGGAGGGLGGGAGVRAGAGREQVAGLRGALMAMIVLPYQGQAAANREAARPVPARRRVLAEHRDPLRDLDMRLTYRTVRVLVAIAGRPGASNRQVADASGVQDQGQISKLLARLEHLGLIHNDGAGPARGEPNVWRLTPRGQEIEHTISRQATPAGS
jgi:AcrR family transcriptional regulator/DNA-binding MarR family transcriptional regulator